MWISPIHQYLYRGTRERERVSEKKKQILKMKHRDIYVCINGVHISKPSFRAWQVDVCCLPDKFQWKSMSHMHTARSLNDKFIVCETGNLMNEFSHVQFWRPQTLHGVADRENLWKWRRKKRHHPNKKKPLILEKRSAKFTRIVSIGIR